MFAKQKQVAGASYGRERFEYLEQLVSEFQITSSIEAKEQVLANLANFAYDPMNFEYLRKLRVIDIFLENIQDLSNSTLAEFSIGGLCNLVLDKTNKEYIIKNGGVQFVINLLSSDVEEIVLSAVTTLMFLVTPATKKEVTATPVIEWMLQFSSQLSNRRLSNLATVFLQDYCTSWQVQAVRDSIASMERAKAESIASIPLPELPPAQ